jgi:ferric-dicitrate binding protein FerR (iron transport regulator)
MLDSTQGNLVKQGGLMLVNHAGKLKYEGIGANTEYNTISTPKGGQYQIELPDGSKAWLNAASSITFPTAFTKDRKVTVTGEVYMEIAKDKTKPFLVSSNEVQIQVLGTSFNVNVYKDEPGAKVTLVEGAVNVDNTRLKPGQAYVNGKVMTTDLQQDLAWKNGAFNLNNKTLPELMRQIARWYDLEIVYEKPVRTGTFEGEMGRDLTLPQCLRALEKMQVSFRLEGKKLIVLP